MDNGNPTRTDNGVHLAGKIALVLEYDCVTHQVSIGGDTMQCSLAQMICDEGARVLAEQRRMAVAMALQQQMAERAQAQAIANSVRGGRH
jgi:hypothetical protein